MVKLLRLFNKAGKDSVNFSEDRGRYDMKTNDVPYLLHDALLIKIIIILFDLQVENKINQACHTQSCLIKYHGQKKKFEQYKIIQLYNHRSYNL